MCCWGKMQSIFVPKDAHQFPSRFSHSDQVIKATLSTTNSALSLIRKVPLHHSLVKSSASSVLHVHNISNSNNRNVFDKEEIFSQKDFVLQLYKKDIRSSQRTREEKPSDNIMTTKKDTTEYTACAAASSCKTSLSGALPGLVVAPEKNANRNNSIITSSSNSNENAKSFTALRVNYLLVTIAIMLADGLQGTHLYVLYEGYGFSVASLYALGFVAGAVTTPITGPLIDKFGRKRSALLYCILEIGINMLEQFPFLTGLIVSRVVGGITTNLLSSVFETWLDTEYRRRGLDSDKYEIIMRDSVVVSNISAILSGYLAHILAERYGPVGPFRGAVTCTALALVVVFCLWTENFGGGGGDDEDVVVVVGDEETKQDKKGKIQQRENQQQQYQAKKGLGEFVQEAITICKNDSRVLRVGIIQGLTAGSLQTFIYLWTPTLQTFANHIPQTHTPWGLDSAREPAYGLIFGAFMAAGVAGGFLSPMLRKLLSSFVLSRGEREPQPTTSRESTTKQVDEERPAAVEVQAAFCYMLCAGLLYVPFTISEHGQYSFSISLGACLIYELIVGVMMPCEGVIRSMYLPSDARATMMTLPRIIVNLAVAVGVIMTKSITTQSAFGIVSLLMMTAAALQLSLVLTMHDLRSFFSRTFCFARARNVSEDRHVENSKQTTGLFVVLPRRFSFSNFQRVLRESFLSEAGRSLLTDDSSVSVCDLSTTSFDEIMDTEEEFSHNENVMLGGRKLERAECEKPKLD